MATISKQDIIDFITIHPLGVVATANSAGYPHAATVYFLVDTDLEIYFITKEHTLKSMNIEQNPLAAIAINDDKNQQTLQAHGQVEQIHDENLRADLYKKVQELNADTSQSSLPPIAKLMAGDYVLYRLIPKELRLANYLNPDAGNTEIFDHAVSA